MSKGRIFKLPLVGRFAVAFDRHGAATRAQYLGGGAIFETNLSVKVFDKDGNERKVKDYFGSSRFQKIWHKILYRNNTVLDLGSGLVTNVAVLAMANDWGWSPTNAPHSVIRNSKHHATGTGAAAALATDIKLQTASAFGGQTPVTGTQVLLSGANSQRYQTVATVAYTGTEAVTEWGLLAYGGALPATTALSDATGSPFTSGTATTGTVTATPLTASSTTALGQQFSIFERTSGTNLSYGLVTSNTTAVVTTPAWYLVATGAAGQAPANTETYVIRPIMLDHKQFAAVNVISGDSIQFTYTLTINSGG